MQKTFYDSSMGVPTYRATSATRSSVVTSAVLPGHTSLHTGTPSPSITIPSTICLQSLRWSLLLPYRPSVSPPPPVKNSEVVPIELGEQRPASSEQLLLDGVLGAPRRGRVGLAHRELLAEPPIARYRC